MKNIVLLETQGGTMKKYVYEPAMTWAQIARELKISEERVYELYNNAMKKLIREYKK